MLVASALFFIIGAAFFEQDVNITVLASYLHRRLRPAILAELAEGPHNNALMGWEEFRHQFFLPSTVASMLTYNRTLLTYLPGLATIVLYLYLKYATSILGKDWNSAEVALLILNVVLAAFLVKLGSQVPRLYEQITVG